jgi:hypothetical protein
VLLSRQYTLPFAKGHFALASLSSQAPRAARAAAAEGSLPLPMHIKQRCPNAVEAVESTTGELPQAFLLPCHRNCIELLKCTFCTFTRPHTLATIDLNRHTPSDYFSRFTMFSQLTKQQTTGLWMWRMEYEHHEQRPLYFGEWF